MLNIKNVQERLLRNPEPKIVSEIREKILDSFKDIEFVEKGHKYFLNKPGEEMVELECVSNVVKRFTPFTDWDEKAAKTALKRGTTKEEIQEEWACNATKSCIAGTVVHEYGEMWHYFMLNETDKITDRFKIQYENGYFYPASPKQEAINLFHEDLFKIDNIYPVLAETKVYSEKYRYSGTFDKLMYYHNETDPSKSGLYIMDYKTNGSLINDYCRNFNVTMLPPFDSLIDEALSHYIIQQSLYQIPLEDIGFKTVNRVLIWLKPDGTYEKINCNDVTKILRTVL